MQLVPLIARVTAVVFRCRGCADLPLFQQGIEQGLTVPEVPVETALGDPQRLPEHLDPQAADALAGQDVDGGIHPAFRSSWVRGSLARPAGL